MYPSGSRVTVLSVDHLVPPHKHRQLIGRTGTVWEHENGMNIVAGLTWHDRVSGLHVFGDQHLEPAEPADPPRMPPVYAVRAYQTPDR
jgi:hypothetical protein